MELAEGSGAVPKLRIRVLTPEVDAEKAKRRPKWPGLSGPE